MGFQSFIKINMGVEANSWVVILATQIQAKLKNQLGNQIRNED